MLGCEVKVVKRCFSPFFGDLETVMPTSAVVIYPSVIARACAALDESPVFSDLPDGYFRVVIRIVKKINLARLISPIFASRARLAEESGKSVETVGRVIKWLEDKGLIMRTQKSRAGFRGSSSPLVPTKYLLESLLLYPNPKTKSSEADDKEASTTAPTECNTTYPQGQQTSPVSGDVSKSMSQRLNNPTENNRQASSFVKLNKLTIPADLAWLVTENGIKPTGVLKLMSEAKLVEQRLSDVVTATKRYLEPLKGRELFAYLSSLLSKGKDFGYQAKTIHKQTQEANQRERISRKAIELAGRKFATRNGTVIVFVEKSGTLSEIRNGVRSARPMCQEFLDALESGQLIAQD